MKIRPHALFRAAFPDDFVWDDNDELVEAGGRGVAEAMAAIVGRLGYQVSVLEYEPEHGSWEFIVRMKTGELMCRIVQIDETWLLSTSSQSIDLWPKPSDYAELLIALDAELRKDGRFSDIGWLPEKWQFKKVAPEPHPVDP